MASLPLMIGAAGALKGSSSPKLPAQIPMPDPEVLKQQRKKTAASGYQSGRASTILTDTGGLG
jgi:hypothetical protein